MTEDLFRDFWWLMFPMFGMVMALIGVVRSNDEHDRILRDARRELERRP